MSQSGAGISSQSISLSSLSPYASFIALKSSGRKPSGSRLINEVKNICAPTQGWHSELELLKYRKGRGAFHLVEKKATAWSGRNGAALQDELNHLLAVFMNEKYTAIYLSDSDSKLRLYEGMSKSKLAGWELVDEEILIRAYIENQKLKALWLGGTHRNVTIKPNSKILNGEDLADAIDPFGDSTFVAGAVRSGVAGVSLNRSGVWFGPKKDWHSFESRAFALLNDLKKAETNVGTSAVFVNKGLATNVTTFNGVGPAYAIEWAAEETMQGLRRARALEKLKEEFALNIGPSASPSSTPASVVPINVTHIESGSVASFNIAPSFVSRRVVFSIGAKSGVFSKFVSSVESDAELLRIFYDSGHTIANAKLSQSVVQDRVFDFEFKDFVVGGFKYNVSQEKPPGRPPPINDMFQTQDVSLFKWVFKEGLQQLNLQLPAQDLCWLYCDDGAGEVADFVHLCTPVGGTSKITL